MLIKSIWVISIRWVFVLWIAFALTGCEQQAEGPANIKEKGPSLIFKGFQAFGSRGETREWQAWAKRAEVYNQKKIAVADDLKVNYFKNGKVVSVLRADRGEISTASQDVTATGHVVLRGQNGVVLKTEHLYWDHLHERIFTPDAVKVLRKDTVMTGVGLVSDRNLGSIEILKNIKIQARSVKALRQLGDEFGGDK